MQIKGILWCLKRAIFLIIFLMVVFISSGQGRFITKGDSLFFRFIEKNIQYPEKQADSLIGCTLLVKIIITKDGKINYFNTDQKNVFSLEIERVINLAKLKFTKHLISKGHPIVLPIYFIPENGNSSETNEIIKTPRVSQQLRWAKDSVELCYIFPPLHVIGYYNAIKH